MTKKVIAEFDLLLIANQIIQSHDDYIEGMRANSVVEKDDVLIFKGEYFLDSNRMPTENNTHNRRLCSLTAYRAKRWIQCLQLDRAS